MPATILRGATFVSTVTAGGLHALVTAATISNIDRANIAANYSVATRQGLNDPADKEVIQDQQSNQLQTYDTATARFRPGMSILTPFRLASTSLAIVVGDLLFPTNLGQLDPVVLGDITVAATTLVVGVSTRSVAPNGDSVCITAGVAKVRSTGTIERGQAVVPSGLGLAQAAAAEGLGFGSQVFGVALEAASGGFVWINLRR